MNASLDIDFKIAEPWIEAEYGYGMRITGKELIDYYEKNNIRCYHCRNCGAQLNWEQKNKSHYTCWNCKYDGDYKNTKANIEFEI